MCNPLLLQNRLCGSPNPTAANLSYPQGMRFQIGPRTAHARSPLNRPLQMSIIPANCLISFRFCTLL